MKHVFFFAVLLPLALALSACSDSGHRTAQRHGTTNTAFEFLTVDMGLLDYQKRPKDLVAEWYEINGKRAETPETVAKYLSEQGWELVTPQLVGKVSFKRPAGSAPATDVKQRSKSRYE